MYLKKLKQNQPLRALVFSNLTLLLGILFLGWNVGSIIVVYWLENVVIGFYNVLKMNKVEGQFSPLILFFIFHFGLFTFVHGIFVFIFFAGFGVNKLALLYGLISLMISHGVSYKENYLRKGEYRKLSLVQVMFMPYRRVVVLHLVVILGGFSVQALSIEVLAGIILVAVKTIVDIVFHLLEHRNNLLKNKKKSNIKKSWSFRRKWDIKLN